MADSKTTQQGDAPTAGDKPLDGGDLTPAASVTTTVPWRSSPDAWQWKRLAALQDGSRPTRDEAQDEQVKAITRSQAMLRDKQAQSGKAARAWSQARDEEAAVQADLARALDAALEGETEDQAQPAEQDQPDAAEGKQDTADGQQP